MLSELMRRVTQGLLKIDGTDGETETKGLGNLEVNLPKYKSQGAVFAKWRAALKVMHFNDVAAFDA